MVTLLLLLIVILLVLIILNKRETFKCPNLRLGCPLPMKTPKLHFHFVKNWAPKIKVNMVTHHCDFYLKSMDFKNIIFNNVKKIYEKTYDENLLAKNSNINFDEYKFYYEDAYKNFATYYSNFDKIIDLELDSVIYNLQDSGNNKDNKNQIIKQNLEVLVDLELLESKKGIHMYFVPYIGKDTYAKTIVLSNGIPVTFMALYVEKDNKLMRTMNDYPKFQNNMKFSKMCAQHLGYLFGLEDSQDKKNLMNFEMNKFDEYEIFSQSSKKLSFLDKLFTLNKLDHKKIFRIFIYLTRTNTEPLEKKDMLELKEEVKDYEKVLAKLRDDGIMKNKIIGDLILFYGDYFFNKHNGFDISDSRILELNNFKSQNNKDKFKHEIKNIFQNSHIKVLAKTVALITNLVGKELNIEQIGIVRANFTDKYPTLSQTTNPDIINIEGNKVEEAKIFCHQYRKNYLEHHDHPCHHKPGYKDISVELNRGEYLGMDIKQGRDKKAVVTRIYQNGAVYKNGLIHVGDIIESINRKRTDVLKLDEIKDLLYKKNEDNKYSKHYDLLLLIRRKIDKSCNKEQIYKDCLYKYNNIKPADYRYKEIIPEENVTIEVPNNCDKLQEYKLYTEQDKCRGYIELDSDDDVEENNKCMSNDSKYALITDDLSYL